MWGARFSPNTSLVTWKWMVNATLTMGHQADPAHCYKFHILQTNSQYAIFYNIIWGLETMTNSQNLFPTIQLASCG